MSELDINDIDAFLLKICPENEKNISKKMALNQVKQSLVRLKSLLPKTSVKATDSVTEPVVEPLVEPVVDHVTEPVVESVAEPVTDPVAEPVTDPVAEPVTDPVAETVVEPVEQVKVLVSEPVKPPQPIRVPVRVSPKKIYLL